MTDNQRKILEMLADKKISVDEASRLLELVQTETGGGARETKQSKGLPKYLRVVVKSKAVDGKDDEHGQVNVRVPMALIRAGVKFTSLIPPSAYNKVDAALKEKGIEFDLRNMKPDDIEELVSALSELEVDIQDGKEYVRVFVE
jgi:hypothetical protein